MERSVGKLVNCDSNAELSFSLTPTELHVDQAFELKIEPCLARTLPIVSFQGGGVKTLSTHLIFDKDADDSLDLNKVQNFLNSLSKVDAQTQSIPLMIFKLGPFSFKGYPQRMALTYARFSSSGQASQLKVDLAIVSAEEGDHAKG